MIDAALWYATRGRRVLPCWWLGPDGRCACRGRPDCRPGKHPLFRNWPQNATTNPAILTSWWQAHTLANIGLMMGDGMVAIDIDPCRGGDETFSKLQRAHGHIGRTPKARTRSGGHHVFVRVDGAFRKSTLPGGIDLLGDASYVLVAPSQGYEWLVAPWDAPPVSAPGWVLATQYRPSYTAPVSPPPSDDMARLAARASAYLATMTAAISGSGGHAATWRAAMALVRGFGLPVDTALDLLVREYNPRCRPPWSLSQLRHKVDDAAKSDAPPWLAASAMADEEPASQWGGSIGTTVLVATYRYSPELYGRPELHRVRFQLATEDGEVLEDRQYVTLPVNGQHEAARPIFEATIADLGPPEAWLDPGERNRFEAELRGRRLDVVLPPGGLGRAVRMRRAS